MELSFGLLLGAFALSFAGAGGAWAHAALGEHRSIYARGRWLGLGLPSALAAALACSTLLLQQFDVMLSTVALGAGLAALGAILGGVPRRGAVLVRGVVWPLASLVFAYATAQALGIV